MDSSDQAVRNRYAGSALDRIEPACALIGPYADTAPQGHDLWGLMVRARQLRYTGHRFLTVPRP
jgi:hypothetical protein